jgi:hypothetical protein
MQERTFDCAQCGASVTVTMATGRPRKFCEECARLRKNLRAQADRASTRAAHTTCQRPGCDNPLPPGSRADRKWCSSACQTWVSRRNTGEVLENKRVCPGCLTPLAGKYANAEQCGSPRCRGWLQRNPGKPHPSTRLRACKQCGASIDHLNGKAQFCRKACRNQWLIEQDREAYNAKAREWQSSPARKAARRAYLKANADRRQQWARADRAKNPERYSRYWKQWAAENTEVLAEVYRMRRARQWANPDSIGVSVWEWRKILNRSQGCCFYCGVKADVIHMDHVVPLAKGGRHAPANVVVSCGRCNVRKHAMFLSVWRYRGRRRLLSA